MTFKVNDFAHLEGKLVQIKKITLDYIKSKNTGVDSYKVQIKLHNDKLLHWVCSKQLQPLSKQIAPKVLFG